MLPNKHVEMQLALSSKLVFNTCIKDESTETTLNFKADPLPRKHKPLLSLQPLLSLHQKESSRIFLASFASYATKPAFWGGNPAETWAIKDPQGTGMTSWNHSSPRLVEFRRVKFRSREKPGFSMCSYCDNLMAYQFKMVFLMNMLLRNKQSILFLFTYSTFLSVIAPSYLSLTSRSHGAVDWSVWTLGIRMLFAKTWGEPSITPWKN